MEQHERFMRRAIDLASRGAGRVAPNPMVGAVLVHEDRIIGEGWHTQYGDPHAEVECLNSVAPEDKPLISESTMYVTLEPCAHQGRQPPCAWRIVKEGIRKVVVGVDDPFPEVAGKGIAILREHGIDVTTGVCEEEARWMTRRFLHTQTKDRPYVILKWAQSADGFIAPSDCARFQLSNHFSQTIVHKWRTEESAIMVGYQTALGDNPQLTARFWSGSQPLRIALDRFLRLPLMHHLLDDSTPTWLVNILEDSEGTTQRVRSSFESDMLPILLQRLKEAGKNSVIVEGGARLLNNFIAEGLWDEARIIVTPKRLRAGLLAPVLPRCKAAWKTNLGDDQLCLFFPPDAGTAFSTACPELIL
jgi:diaminohydroxyphosphoribosylaminopyrimidine deaminase/5-amino-6-(5-phosphoribosylamino)uracil reductase